jgi:hypothetical protein
VAADHQVEAAAEDTAAEAAELAAAVITDIEKVDVKAAVPKVDLKDDPKAVQMKEDQIPDTAADQDVVMFLEDTVEDTPAEVDVKRLIFFIYFLFIILIHYSNKIYKFFTQRIYCGCVRGTD